MVSVLQRIDKEIKQIRLCALSEETGDANETAKKIKRNNTAPWFRSTEDK